jgi:DNA-binding phage protein
MPKKKKLLEQGFCFDDTPILKLKKNAKTKIHDPEKSLKDLDKIGVALLESLMANDTEAFMDILDGYLHVNKSEVAKKSNISRSTVQQAFSKHGNPTLKTLAKIVHESVA